VESQNSGQRGTVFWNHSRLLCPRLFVGGHSRLKPRGLDAASQGRLCEAWLLVHTVRQESDKRRCIRVVSSHHGVEATDHLFANTDPSGDFGRPTYQIQQPDL
jgi:hypothetical protein